MLQDEAEKQLEVLHREIMESTEELNKIRPLYDKQVKEEEDITKEYFFIFDSRWNQICVLLFPFLAFLLYILLVIFVLNCLCHRIMEKEKKLSILYHKQGGATQFCSKAARNKWLQNVIDKYNKVLSSDEEQVIIRITKIWMHAYIHTYCRTME